MLRLQSYDHVSGTINLQAFSYVFAESSMRCTLSLMDGKIGEDVQRVGLYLLYHKTPFVKPLTSQAVDANTNKVIFPFTGREFGVAVRGTCLIDLGLYAQCA